MRAAPGSASETVGFSSVGEPSVFRVGFSTSGVGVSTSSLDLDLTFGVGSSLPSPTCPLSSAPPTMVPDFGVSALLPPPPLDPRPRCRRCRDCLAWAWARASGSAPAWRSPRAWASGVATGPRSTICSTGASSGGSWISLDGLAGRDVHGELDGLAGGQRDREPVQLRGGRHDHGRVQRGSGECDEQRPASHEQMRVPSLAVSARPAPHAPVAPRVRGVRTVLADCDVFNLYNG